MAWWPVVHARLVELLPTLDGWGSFVMHDGQPTTEQGSPRWVSVGYASLDANGGSFDVTSGPVTRMREERGTVTCEFVSWSGDDAMAAHRTATFALFDDLDTAVRANQRLGVLPDSSTTELSAVPVPARGTTGTTHRLIVTLSYFVRS